MSEEKSAALPAGSGASPSPLSKPWLVLPAAIVLAGVLYLGSSYIVDIFTHESTDDAFIAGHVTSVAPRVAGQVAAVYVNDNQMVRSNDLLVEIDPGDYALALAQ
jgi:membrane fusion protein (multidrug efflux system)